MTRSLRIEFPDALYHLTARGDRQESIFKDDEDHLIFLRILAKFWCNLRVAALEKKPPLATSRALIRTILETLNTIYIVAGLTKQPMRLFCGSFSL